MRPTTLFRFRLVAIVALALGTVACANSGTELTGPGGRRAALDVASDSSAVIAAGDSSAVAQDSTAAGQDGIVVAQDSSAVGGDDGGIVALPDDPGGDSIFGYIVAY